MLSISHIVGFVLLAALVAGAFLLFRGSDDRRRTPQSSRSAGAQPWGADGTSGRGNR